MKTTRTKMMIMGTALILLLIILFAVVIVNNQSQTKTIEQLSISTISTASPTSSNQINFANSESAADNIPFKGCNGSNWKVLG